MAIRDLFRAILTADAKGIIAELKNVSSASDGTADKVKKGFGSIKDSVAGGVTSFVDAHPKISGALGKIGIDSQKAGSAIGTALPSAAAAGAAALGAFAAKAVASTMELDAGILAVQRTTGATAEQASALVAIADDFNIGADQLSGALGKLAKNADSKTLQEFGVQLAKNADGTTDLYGTLTNVAEAFAATSDANERARLAQAAFGKSWQQLIPILEQGRGGLENAYEAIGDGQIRTQEQIDASEELRLTFDALSDAAGSLSIVVGTTLIPQIQSLADAALTIKGIFDVIPEPLRNVASFLTKWFSGMTQLSLVTKGAEAVWGKFTEVLGLADDEILSVAKSTDTLGEAFGKTAIKAEQELVKSFKETEKAQKESRKAADDLFKSLDKVNLSFDEGKTSSDAFARALRGLVLEALDNQAAWDRWSASWDDTVKTLREGAGSLDSATEAGRRNRAQIRENIRDTVDYARVMVEQEGNVDGAREAVENHRQALVEQLVSLGHTQEAAEAYIAQLGLTPKTVDTIVQIKDDEVAKARIEAVRSELEKLPPEIQSMITPVVDAESAQKAADQLAVLTAMRTIRLEPVISGGNIGGILPGAVSGMGGGTSVVVNNYLPPATDGEDVVAASTRWARRNGGAF